MTSEQAPAPTGKQRVATVRRVTPSLGWMTAPEWSLPGGQPSAAMRPVTGDPALTRPARELAEQGHESEMLELSSGAATPGLDLLETPRTPVDENLIESAADLLPGKALDLGCGEGQNALWLAQRGWVVTAVDMAPEPLADARRAAAAAGLTIAFVLADMAAWRPVSRYDLVICTFALPPRGMGRSRVLEMAATAVAPGGRILVSDLDVALAREGRMAERYLVSTDEIERHLDGFRVDRSRTRLASRRHGFEEIVVPVATVTATRRTDLRTLY